MESVMAVLNFDELLDLRERIEERMKRFGISKKTLGTECPAFLNTPFFACPGNKTEIPPATIAELGYVAGRLGLKIEITGIRIL